MAGKQDGPGDPNSEWTYIVAILVVGMIFWLVWHFFTKWVVLPAFAVNWLELHVVSLFHGNLADAGAVDRMGGHFTGRYDAKDMSWAEFYRLTTYVGERARFYVMAMVLAMMVLVIFRMRGEGFKNHWTLTSLMGYQSKWWLTAAPSAAFDPDASGPEWQPARTGFEFLRDNKISVHGLKIDRQACAAVFRKTLGGRWNGVRELPIHSQCIAVMSGVHSKRDADLALKLRQQVAHAYAWLTDPAARKERLEGLLAPWLADEALVRYIDKLGNNHAFVNTAVMRILDKSRRESGVLACAEFLWLKGIDRDLWYACNNCGRRAYHAEGAGCVSHFDAERITSSALPEPHVDAAVDGIQGYIDEHQVGPDVVLRIPEADD